MAIWWKSKERKEREMLLEQSREIAERQPGSLLQSFIDFTNQKKDLYQVTLRTEIEEFGTLNVHCEFTDEKKYSFRMSKNDPFIIQDNPEKIFPSLYKSERLNQVISEFHRLEGLQKEIDMDNEMMTHIRFRTGKPLDYDEMHELVRLSVDVKNREKEVARYMKTVWFNSPFLAERLHAVYRAFLSQHTASQTVSPADRIEADLMDILNDDELSKETKRKAQEVLRKYREEHRFSKDVAIQAKEDNAQAILRTVESHYLKGR